MERTPSSAPLPLFYHEMLEGFQLDFPHDERRERARDVIESMNQKEKSLKEKKQKNTEELDWLRRQERETEASVKNIQVKLSTSEKHYKVESEDRFKKEIEAQNRLLANTQEELNRIRKSIDQKEHSLKNSLTRDEVEQRKNAQTFLDYYADGYTALYPFLPSIDFSLPNYQQLLKELGLGSIDEFYYYVEGQLVRPELLSRYFDESKMNRLYAMALEYYQMLTHPATKAFVAYGMPLVDLHRDYYCHIRAHHIPGPPLSHPLLGLIEYPAESSGSTNTNTRRPSFYTCFKNVLYTHEFVDKVYKKIR
jgi:hypothetical protein